MGKDHDALPLSHRQRSSLKGIVDGLLPPLPPPESHTDKEAKGDPEKQELVRGFWEYQLSADDSYMTVLENAIQTKLSSTESHLLKLLLNIMSSVLGSMLLFGRLSIRPFSQWSVSTQTAALKKLQTSPIQTKRKAFNGLKRLICGIAFSYVPEQAMLGHSSTGNPFWKAMGYPGPPQWSISPTKDAKRIKKGLSRNVQSIEKSLLNISEDVVLDCDVVIIGSGAGGSVAASVLSSKGYSVVVLEKGPYLSPYEITNIEADAFDRMYEAHGLLTSADGNLMVLAGATVGGGTVINWSCCLPLPDYVRIEWVQEHGLEQFGDEHDFCKSMNIVMNRIGCIDKSRIKHNPMNKKLQQGCDNLDYEWSVTGQNLKSSAGASGGYVCFGDRYGIKNNALATFLGDASSSGARIVDNCKVRHILKESYVSSDGIRGLRAKGVAATVGDHHVTVRARRGVICAAGSLHTPCVLKRSGFCNWHIGRHLHLHPATYAIGMFNDEIIDSCLHPPMTTVCNALERGPRNNGYGAKIECPSAHTGLAAAVIRYRSPRDFKENLLQLRHAVPLIAIQRDSTEGRVHLAADGFSPKVDYVVNDADKESIKRSVQGLVKILISSGSDFIATGHNDDSGLDLASADGPMPKNETKKDVQDYLKKLQKLGLSPHQTQLFTAHQMGSCRMGTSLKTGAIDENGETWECDDMFVMDASTFPTASGANPMLTTLAMSHMLSSRLARRLEFEDEKGDSSDQAVLQAMLQKRAENRGHAFLPRTASMIT